MIEDECPSISCTKSYRFDVLLGVVLAMLLSHEWLIRIIIRIYLKSKIPITVQWTLH